MKTKSILKTANLISILLLATLILCMACVTPTQSGTPSGTAAPVQPAKTWDLKFSTHFAPGGDDATDFESLGKLIAEKTGSKVKFTFYHGETLGKVNDFGTMLDKGVHDCCVIIGNYYPGKFDSTTLFDLPMIGLNRPMAQNVAWELYYQGLFKEYANYKVLGFRGSDPMGFFMKKKASSFDELKGLKIRAPGPAAADLFTNMGITPVSMTSGELYMAMDRGVLDGLITGGASILSRKLTEVGKCYIANPIISGAILSIVMNKNTWNSLPPDIQIQVDQAIAEFKYVSERFWQPKDAAFIDSLKKANIEIVYVSADEMKKAEKYVAPVWTKWTADMKAKGQLGQELIDATQKIKERYQ
jgi:TRAP-type transport system periplasmic protein